MESFEPKPDNPIEQIAFQMSAAFNTRDAVALASFYTDTATLMPPNEPIVRGAAAIQVWFEQALQRLNSIRLAPMESTVLGEHAFQVGRFIVASKTINSSSSDNTEHEQAGKYLLVLKRAAGQWKIHYDIWSLDKAPS